MCIVSFVKNEGWVIITFNRDENPKRPFADMGFHNGLLYPVDLLAGGTWTGASSIDIACLQNGAREPHIRNLPYGQSRGILLLDILKGKSVADIATSFSSIKTEPFTLSIFNRQSQLLHIFTYDGNQLQHEENNLEIPLIMYSSPLYDKSSALKITQDFDHLMLKTPEHLLGFHHAHRIQGIHPVTTGSITQYLLQNGNGSCFFNNLLTHTALNFELPLLASYP